MGLDKWLNPEEVPKKDGKKPTQVKREILEGKDIPKTQLAISKLTKYTLNCPNSKCKYQKTVMKKVLTVTDKICPRCNEEMKVKISS